MPVEPGAVVGEVGADRADEQRVAGRARPCRTRCSRRRRRGARRGRRRGPTARRCASLSARSTSEYRPGNVIRWSVAIDPVTATRTDGSQVRRRQARAVLRRRPYCRGDAPEPAGAATRRSRHGSHVAGPPPRARRLDDGRAAASSASAVAAVAVDDGDDGSRRGRRRRARRPSTARRVRRRRRRRGARPARLRLDGTLDPSDRPRASSSTRPARPSTSRQVRALLDALGMTAPTVTEVDGGWTATGTRRTARRPRSPSTRPPATSGSTAADARGLPDRRARARGPTTSRLVRRDARPSAEGRRPGRAALLQARPRSCSRSSA